MLPLLPTFLFIKCKEATRLSIRAENDALRGMDKIRWRIHLLYCRLCRRFSIQSKQISSLLRGASSTTAFKLSDEKRARLKKQVEDALGH